MKIDWGDNKLTDSIREKLKQGTRVKFRWYGSYEEYVGRIEVDQYGRLYFVNEFNYTDELLNQESMRFYNTLDSFFHFTSFEII